MPIIRFGKTSDLVSLTSIPWAYNNFNEVVENYSKKIEGGIQVFFVLEENKKIIGEIHIFLKDGDKEKADGKRRVYLSTFRIAPDWQKQGWGKKLFDTALEYVEKNGYSELVIGAYKNDLEMQNLYKRWGFDKVIKITEEIECGKPVQIIYLLKKL